MTVRLPEDLHRQLRATSERMGSSLNQVIVTALCDAIDWIGSNGTPTDPHLEEVRRVRLALGDLSVEFDPEDWPESWRPHSDLPDTDTIRAMMPLLDPPMSATIIAEREDRV